MASRSNGTYPTFLRRVSKRVPADTGNQVREIGHTPQESRGAEVQAGKCVSRSADARLVLFQIRQVMTATGGNPRRLRAARVVRIVHGAVPRGSRPNTASPAPG